MRIRSIAEGEVIKAIQEPDVTGLLTRPGRERVRMYRGETRSVDVIYEVFKDRVLVVTAMIVSLKTHERP